MTIPRPLFAQLGGFSTEFPTELLLMPDDLEFYHRVHQAGYSAYYACASRSHHQTHLDSEYRAYQAFKDRQYHLLATRFFTTARTRAGYAPWFVEVKINPAQAAPGDEVQLQVQINTSSAMSVGIGMSVRAGPSAPWLHDPSGDRLVTLRAGTHGYDRTFRLPPDAPTGTYDVSAGLYENLPGSGAHDHVVLPAALEVQPARAKEPHARRRRKGSRTAAA